MQPTQDRDTTDLFAPVPAVRISSLVGYTRVSTKGQLLNRQIHALDTAGCIRIFSDKKSGKNAEREELWKALDYLRDGDTLVVLSLDRLGRSIQDLIAIGSGRRKRGVGFTSLATRRSTQPRPAGACLPRVRGRSRSSSANSSGRAPTRAWMPPAPAEPDSAARQGCQRNRFVTPATCSPGEHRHRDRKAPRRLQEHDLQLRARAEGRSPHTC
ncbi:recombinase family protein [Streptomyces sp. NPDC056549]|uniref:recombinase family protein n=1 Tax=Streptomyces sp. NPDC056549 TaxID=3345864 RepID=UPI0036ADC069